MNAKAMRKLRAGVPRAVRKQKRDGLTRMQYRDLVRDHALLKRLAEGLGFSDAE